MDNRSKSNPSLFNNTLMPGLLIKFPTITKMLYEGDNFQPNKNMYRTTNIKTTSKPTVHGGTLTQTNTFRLVELPSDEHLMKICMMEINHQANRYKSVQKQSYTEDKQSKANQQMTKTLIKKQKSVSLMVKLDDNKARKQVFNKALGNPLMSKEVPLNKTDRNLTQSLFKIKINQNNLSIPENKININEFYTQVMAALSLINGEAIINSSKNYQRIRRAKIDKGNNGYLVKQTIKKRTWWNTTEQLTEANLIWTERSVKLTELSSLNRQKFYVDIDQQEQKKYCFQRNIDQMLLYYPKILQLFFTQDQIEQMLYSNFSAKSKKSYFLYNYFSAKRAMRKIIPENILMFNHVPNHQEITSKKLLYKNLWRYYHEIKENPYEYIPKTYHITAFDWQQKIQFIREEERKKVRSQKNRNIPEAWFLKPGQNTNRGKGIQMFKSTNEVLDYILRNPPRSVSKTYILQQYINPMLYQSRKFDIRCYILCVQVFNVQTFYWYEEGYIRTSSTKFTMNKTSISIHLTNDAVQKQFDNYDKYQSANKLSYAQIDKYIKNEYGYNFLAHIVPKMKKIATDVAKSALDMGSKQNENADEDEQETHRKHKVENEKETKDRGLYFEIFGLDFIISKEGDPYLLEVNTNPCLQINSNLLSRVIPDVVQNTFRIVTDVFMPNRSLTTNNNTISINANNMGSLCPDWAQNFLLNNKFSLIHRRYLQREQLIDKPGQDKEEQNKEATQKISEKQRKEIAKKDYTVKWSNPKYRITPDLTKS